jgi:AcrR family transcriptional regulator
MRWQSAGMTDAAAVTSKSGRTRAAILTAARELFAERGYERTTVRDVAARAGIDPAMVIRYFGSKDGLFARAAAFDLRLPDLSGRDRAGIGRSIVRHFLDVWEGDHADAGLAILLRSAAVSPAAAEKLEEIFAGQVVPALARASGAPDAAARAGLVSSQILGLAFCRYVLRLPPVVALAPERIVDEVGATVQRYLFGPP